MSRKDEILSESLGRVIDWIKFADTKAAAVGTLCVVYLGFSKSIAVSYINLLTDTYTKHQSVTKLIIPTITVSGLFYFLARTLLFIFRTLKPKTDNPDYNPLFFAHIAQKSYSEYAKLINKRTVAQLNTDMLKQTHMNASIATKKYQHVNEAVLSIIISTVLLLLAGISLSVAHH